MADDSFPKHHDCRCQPVPAPATGNRLPPIDLLSQISAEAAHAAQEMTIDQMEREWNR